MSDGSVRVELGGEVRTATTETWQAVADEMVARHGGVPKVTVLGADVAAPAAPEFSTWNKQVVDEAAKVRIEAQHAALKAAGVAVDSSKQLYATGTRMAREGYDNQEARQREHAAKQPLREAAGALRAVVEGEGREDMVVTARELAATVRVNGRVSVAGLALTEQAIRGMLGRVESPALSYVLGLRDRIRAAKADLASAGDAEREKVLTAHIAADKTAMARVFVRELEAAGDQTLKLRTRKARGDVFAVVSPKYSPADAPEVIDQILGDLPTDARGSWAYDPSSTAWELRASLWTPTPVAEQAVGEPFEGYVSFQGRDAGNGALKGGGGVTMLRCLNASTYVAGGANASRIHLGRILYDMRAMMRSSLAAVDELCQLWGRARQEELRDEHLVGLPVSRALPGIWFGELLDRKSELAGVLPGRTAQHVQGLTAAYMAERRDLERLVRADLGQAWTRYVQGQSGPVRRDAEAAVANWLAAAKPIRFDADRV